DLVRDVGAEARRQRLPLAREQTVPLQVPERAVVGDDLEAVGQRLEAAAGPVAPVLPLGDQVADERGAFVGRQTGDRGERLLLADRRGLVQERGEQLLLAAVRAEETDGRSRHLL